VEQKLRHILTTYEKHLSPHGAALMGIVALFRAAVEESLIRSVATQASCLKGLFSHFGEDVLHAELVALCEEDLMLRNDCGSLGFLYSCHPLVRDYYQRVLLTRYETVASEVASILLKQPGEKLRTGAARLEPIITAVKLLIDTGDITRADRVFIEQLRDGNEFRDLPAPADGLWCVRNFVRDESHRTDCERVLGADRFAFLLVTAGLFAMLAGEPKLAAEYYRDAATVTRSRTILWRVLQNRAILLAHLGSPEEADDLAKRALSLAVEDGNEDEIRSSLVCLAYVLAVRGLVELACQKLEEANRIRSSADSADNLTHTDGVFQARVLLWLGETGRARELTRRNLDLCKDTNDNANVSRCHFILGAIALAEKQLATSRRHLRFAETIMRQTHQFLELPLVLAARADLHRRAREWDDAFRCVTDALDLSASRGWGIAHTDSLLMRGWITLDCIGHNGARNRHFDAWAKHRKINRSLNMYGDRGWATKDPSIGWEVMRADDDAYNARRLARAYGYFRAEQDALLLLHETCFALGESADGL
jgi:tetratricopeptide (TPR) repeat protein